MKLQCPACLGSFVAVETGESAVAYCPHCGESVRRPISPLKKPDDDFDLDLDFLDDDSQAGSPIFEEPKAAAPLGITRTCPMCGESVGVRRTHCQACGEEMPASSAAGKKPPRNDVKTKFRQQIVALGGYWIFMGLLLGGLSVAFLDEIRVADRNVNERDLSLVAQGGTAIVLVTIVFALVHIVAGALAIGKSVPAVFAGLVLTYLSLALNGLMILMPMVNQAIPAGCCGGVFFGVINVVVIMQSHRVIGWSKEITV